MRLAIVHHANQYLISDGYEDRDGIGTIADGYLRVFEIHERHRVPLSLHLSGTLIEVLAWWRPDVLARVRTLLRTGALELVGGTYAENVMPLFSRDVNARQLRELLELAERHLAIDPRAVRVAWVPERVWSTSACAPVLRDPTLANGGYAGVLLDDRLRYEGEARLAFDAAVARGEPLGPDRLRPWRIRGGLGLVAIPISTPLRRAVPPEDAAQRRAVAELLGDAAEQGGVLVYADDLERAAGVGGWDRRHLQRYADLIARLVRERTRFALVSDCLARDAEERPTPAGTYVELAREWRAGEDYRRWWQARSYAPWRAMLTRSVDAVRAATDAEPSLLDLAWKHALASMYETAWHDADGTRGRRPAGWAKALASHSRAALVVLAAARHFAAPAVAAELADVDEDGEQELVLRDRSTFAVVSPRHGGRIVYLFARSAGRVALVVGAPADDWNLQCELNVAMRRPANHLGALADLGHEDDRYEVRCRRVAGATASAVLVNVQRGSPLRGAVKGLATGGELPYVAACYRSLARAVSVGVAVAPDYLALLRGGRDAACAADLAGARAWRTSDACVWVCAEGDRWQRTTRAAPHAFVASALLRPPHRHLTIGASVPPRRSFACAEGIG